MRNHILERTIRRLEKQVDTLQTTYTAHMSSVVCGHGATGVHNMPWSASLLIGEEKRNQFGVVPTSHPQVVDRSAGTRVVVREPLEVGSKSAGVGDQLWLRSR